VKEHTFLSTGARLCDEKCGVSAVWGFTNTVFSRFRCKSNSKYCLFLCMFDIKRFWPVFNSALGPMNECYTSSYFAQNVETKQAV